MEEHYPPFDFLGSIVDSMSNPNKQRRKRAKEPHSKKVLNWRAKNKRARKSRKK